MARQPSRNPGINRILQYEVSQEQEAELMIRYTDTVTRELVFAVDLMDLVMRLSNHRLPNCTYSYGSPGQSDFDQEMKRFVELFLEYKLRAPTLLIMEEILSVDSIGYREFKRFVNCSAIATEALLRGGEDGTCIYWVFCIVLAEMCTIAYRRGLVNAPHFGIMLMCRTFANFDIKSAFDSYPWTYIKEIAYRANSGIEMIRRGRWTSIQLDPSRPSPL